MSTAQKNWNIYVHSILSKTSASYTGIVNQGFLVALATLGLCLSLPPSLVGTLTRTFCAGAAISSQQGLAGQHTEDSIRSTAAVTRSDKIVLTPCQYYMYFISRYSLSQCPPPKYRFQLILCFIVVASEERIHGSCYRSGGGRAF